MAMGRPRKSERELKLSGTFKKVSSRKNWNDENPIPLETRTAPSRYLGRTKKAWDQFMLTKAKQGVLALEDEAAITMMFDSLDLYYRTYDKVEILNRGVFGGNKIDDELLDKYNKIDIIMNRQFQRFEKLACRFGITPSERSKLRVKEEAPKSELLRILEEG